MRHTFSINGTKHDLTLAQSGSGYQLRVEGGAAHRVQLLSSAGGSKSVSFDGCVEDALVAPDGDRMHIHIAGTTYEIAYIDPLLQFAGDGGQSADDVALAPMPGTVIAVHVSTGDTVQTGEPLIVIESMKLETTVKAWRPGTIEKVHVGKGDSFERQAALVTLTSLAGGV